MSTRATRLDARVMVAALRCWARDGRLTNRAILAEADIARYGDVEQSLRRLRAAGLITWEDGTMGTLRPTCAVVVL